MHTSVPARTWARFDRRLRKDDVKLLAQLPRFPDAVLVAGCQRSGTTVLTRILRDALEMPSPGITRDDELEAALILAGAVPFESATRCCFQTTYLNDHVNEYFEHDNFQLVWVMRRPEDVVRSMLFNWKRGALNRLFRSCGRHALDDRGLRHYERFGSFGFSRAEMACLSYNAKMAQIHEIAAHLGSDRLFLLDYDDLTSRKDVLLPDIFSFASIPYHGRFAGRLRTKNQRKGKQLDNTLRDQIREMCESEYRRAVNLAGNWC